MCASANVRISTGNLHSILAHPRAPHKCVFRAALLAYLACGVGLAKTILATVVRDVSVDSSVRPPTRLYVDMFVCTYARMYIRM